MEVRLSEPDAAPLALLSPKPNLFQVLPGSSIVALALSIGGQCHHTLGITICSIDVRDDLFLSIQAFVPR